MAVEDTFDENAVGPKRATGDLGSFEMQDGKDAIQMSQYAGNVRGARAGGLPMKRTKMLGPGCIPDTSSGPE